MKRLLLIASLFLIHSLPVAAFDYWNPIATKVLKSTFYLNNAIGSCTAFVIDEKRDYVLTAAHCLGSDPEGKDTFVDQTPTKVMSRDIQKDLMVLEVKGLDKPALHLAKDNPKIGEEVASYGFGYALERPFFRVTHISDDKLYIPYDGIGGPFILVDTNFIQGQSGGPVVNTDGDIVMIVQRGSEQGFGLGVGAETIKDKVGKYFSNDPRP